MFKKWIKFELSIILVAALFTGLESCKEKNRGISEEMAMNKENLDEALPKRELSQEFKDYWYAGQFSNNMPHGFGA